MAGRPPRGPDLLTLSRVLGGILVGLLGLSWRVVYVHPEAGRAGATRGRPSLFAFWHGRQLPLVRTHRGEGITVLVSRNTDGQHAVNVLHSLGFRTVRGSTSRGGTEALREMAAVLREGRDGAITPDGPRGPACVTGSGPGTLSRIGGRPVVPIAASAWPALRVRSWDRFIVPLPFAGISIVEGPPLPPMPRGDDGTWTRRLQNRLDAVSAAADLLVSPGARLRLGMLRFAASAALLVGSPFLVLRPATERRERLGRIPGRNDRPVWLHGSSLGELKGLLPFAGVLKAAGLPSVFTCTTPAGRGFLEASGLPGSFAPLDAPACVERFLGRVRPRCLVLAETELWPCMLAAMIRRSAPVILVNGRLSPRSLRGYRLLGPLPGRLLSCFAGILTRSGDDSRRFLELGAPPGIVRSTADAKAFSDPGDPPPGWREVLRRAGRPVLVAGSVRGGEERVVVEAAVSAGFLPVLAPRHLDRVGDCVSALAAAGLRPTLWSAMGETGPDRVPEAVVIDVHGVLARLYGAADVAFVGGTFTDAGGHNVLEPLQRGVPVVVGPNHAHFAELVARGVAAAAVGIAADAGSMAAILRGMLDGRPPAGTLRALAVPGDADPMHAFAEVLRLSGIMPLEGEMHEKS